MKSKSLQRGVTLIELVVVMMIVGILAAIAIPSYRQYIMRSQRSDAKEGLLTLATAQEKFYLQCNTSYATAIAAATNCAAGQLQGTAISKNGWYTLAIAPGANAIGFTVTATAVAGDRQFEDTACRSFSVTNGGVRTALNASNADNTATCW